MCLQSGTEIRPGTGQGRGDEIAWQDMSSPHSDIVEVKRLDLDRVLYVSISTILGLSSKPFKDVS